VLQNLESWPLNTDDRTVIEFAFARSVGASTGFQMDTLRKSAHAAHCDRPEIGNATIDWNRVEEARRNSPNQPIENPANADQVAATAPSDVEVIRAELLWKQGNAKEAADKLNKFFQIAHDDPWLDQSLTKRAIALAETIACSNPAVATPLYENLQAPLCVWNSETDRELRVVSIGTCLDGDHPGEHTARAIEAFEPNVIWERHFLEMRKAAYAAAHSPLAEQASRDLDEFMQHEALTNDASALTREIEIGATQPRQTPR
jgi:hypothetical protein